MKIASNYQKITKIFAFLMKSCKGNGYLFICMFFSNLIAACSEGLSYGCILIALTFLKGEIFSTQTLFSPLANYFNKIYSQGANPFNSFILIAVILQIIRSFLTYLGSVAATILATRIQTEMQKRIYKQILSFSFDFISKYKLGDLVSYIENPSHIIQETLSHVNQVFLSLLAILASFWIMLFLSPQLTALAFITFSLLALSQKFAIEKIGKISINLVQHVTRFTEYIVETLQAIKLIHVFHRHHESVQTMSQTLNQISRCAKKLYFWKHLIGPLNETLGISTVCSFLIFGQWIIRHQTAISLPILLTFLIILHRLNGKTQIFALSISELANKWGQICRLHEILHIKNTMRQHDKKHRSAQLHFGIFFKNVCFRYDSSTEYTLQEIDLCIAKGSTVAIVGHSGSGKSSFIDLLLGLYTPTHGYIRIDEHPLPELDLGSWRNLIGVVLQETFIFNQSIEENIRFGNLHTSFEDIVLAAKLADAHQFIQKMPSGYQTIVGDKGYRLSGGERQKISLARALIRKPPILILDEATSNLDSHSEQIIQEALVKFQKIKTLIVVAHRLSTILHADHIIVLSKGKIEEQGTHADLLNQNGTYAALWDLQSKKSQLSSPNQIFATPS